MARAADGSWRKGPGLLPALRPMPATLGPSAQAGEGLACGCWMCLSLRHLVVQLTLVWTKALPGIWGGLGEASCYLFL